jgi:hypothetical protein
MISGYNSELYNKHLSKWNKKSIKASTEFGGTANEIIWMNYKNSYEQLKMAE